MFKGYISVYFCDEEYFLFYDHCAEVVHGQTVDTLDNIIQHIINHRSRFHCLIKYNNENEKSVIVNKLTKLKKLLQIQNMKYN